MIPIRIWNNKTTLPMSNCRSFPFWCLLTNAFWRFCSCSKCQILRNHSWPSTSSCFDHICSKVVSSNLSLTCTQRFSTQNSMGIMASNPKVSRNGIHWMIILKVVLYAQSALWILVSHSVLFSLTIFFSLFYNVLFVNSANPFACG